MPTLNGPGEGGVATPLTAAINRLVKQSRGSMLKMILDDTLKAESLQFEFPGEEQSFKVGSCSRHQYAKLKELRH